MLLVEQLGRPPQDEQPVVAMIHRLDVFFEGLVPLAFEFAQVGVEQGNARPGRPLLGRLGQGGAGTGQGVAIGAGRDRQTGRLAVIADRAVRPFGAADLVAHAGGRGGVALGQHQLKEGKPQRLLFGGHVDRLSPKPAGVGPVADQLRRRRQ